MTNDPVLALIEKWEADARRQDWPANGEFLTPQECAKQIRAILPQRDRERDAQVQIGTAKHITGGVDDGCMCGPCIILREYLDGERAAIRLAALERVKSLLNSRDREPKWNVGGAGDVPHFVGHMVDYIDDLRTQSDLDWLKRHDAQVRLEEAESWHERVLQIDPHALDEPAFDCCDRIAELRKLVQPGEREREKSKEKQ